MKIPRCSPYVFLATTSIFGILILLISYRKNSDQYIYVNQDTNILVHPEKHLYFDTKKPSKHKLNGKPAFTDLSDVWIDFIPGLYIHSAFADETWENSSEIIIHILCIGRKISIDKNNIKCVFQNNQTIWKESSLDLSLNYEQSFRYLTIICVSKHYLFPKKVTLEYNFKQHKNNWLQVHYKDKDYHSKQHVTVCVLPDLHTFDGVQTVAEFLSYYDSVGVSSFVLYDYNMSKNLKNFIDRTSRSGINITIVPWTLPTRADVPAATALQLASIQHCIFRNRGRTKYVLPINYDEFLIPRQHFSLNDLMDELSTVSKRKVGSYVFRQSYFCKQNVTPTRKDDHLVTSRDIFRQDKIWPSKKRSRYIVRPESVIEGELCYIQKHVKGWTSANVPWQLALIHHYSSCSQKKNMSKLIEDRTAESFRYEILLSRAMVAYREFKAVTK